MGKSFGSLAKLFRSTFTLFFISMLIGSFVVLGYGVNAYLMGKSNDIYWYYLGVTLLMWLYLSIATKVTNIIERKIYKEDFHNIVELFIIHSILYGLITPFALINYYVFYMLAISEKRILTNSFSKTNDTFFISMVLIKVGLYLFIIKLIFDYYNTLVDIYHLVINNQDLSFFNIFKILYLLIGLSQIFVADNELKKEKYINSALRLIIVGILINPFRVHSICFISSGLYILYKKDQLNTVIEKIKNWFEDFRNRTF